MKKNHKVWTGIGESIDYTNIKPKLKDKAQRSLNDYRKTTTSALAVEEATSR
jgi:hypothetical protein|tara:strand:- start:46 stop:201 length:156 start_codon:yes stop_codon:yes gene_type:complete